MERSRTRFRAERTGVGAPLGELEAVIMRHVWANAEQGCLAADVQQALEAERPSALTTILTTLDRLYNKGIVRREREGKAYRFYPAITQEELEQRIVQGVLDNLIARFPKAVANYFAEAGDSVSSLSALARQVAELQRETGESGKADV